MQPPTKDPEKEEETKTAAVDLSQLSEVEIEAKLLKEQRMQLDLAEKNAGQVRGKGPGKLLLKVTKGDINKSTDKPQLASSSVTPTIASEESIKISKVSKPLYKLYSDFYSSIRVNSAMRHLTAKLDEKMIQLLQEFPEMKHIPSVPATNPGALCDLSRLRKRVLERRYACLEDFFTDIFAVAHTAILANPLTLTKLARSLVKNVKEWGGQEKAWFKKTEMEIAGLNGTVLSRVSNIMQAVLKRRRVAGGGGEVRSGSGEAPNLFAGNQSLGMNIEESVAGGEEEEEEEEEEIELEGGELE